MAVYTCPKCRMPIRFGDRGKRATVPCPYCGPVRATRKTRTVMEHCLSWDKKGSGK